MHGASLQSSVWSQASRLVAGCSGGTADTDGTLLCSNSTARRANAGGQLRSRAAHRVVYHVCEGSKANPRPAGCPILDLAAALAYLDHAAAPGACGCPRRVLSPGMVSLGFESSRGDRSTLDGSDGMAQSVKKLLKQALVQLPDDATVEEAMERLLFLSKIEVGIAEADAGKTLSHEEV